MNSCVEAEKYKQDLINLTNNSNLCVSTAYYIAKDFLRDLLRTYEEALSYEQSKNMEPQEEIVKIGNTDPETGVGDANEIIEINKKAE